jgi:hypothetical protein
MLEKSVAKPASGNSQRAVIKLKAINSRRLVMNVIYSSEHFWILAFPAEQGFELFDKEMHRSLFLHGASACHFRQAMECIPADERDEEHIDDFLDDYCDGSANPIVFH